MKKSLMYIVFLLIMLTINSYGQEKRFVAVLNLEQSSMSEGDAQILSDRLRYELFKTGRYTVLEREKMEAIMDEQSLQLSGCVSAECMVEFGKLLGVREIVGGSIGKFGNTYTVNVRLIDVQSGAITASAVFDLTGSKDDLLTRGMKKVAYELSGLKAPDESTTTTVDKKTVKKMPVQTDVPKEKLKDEPVETVKPSQSEKRKKFRRFAFTPMFGRASLTIKTGSSDGMSTTTASDTKERKLSCGGFAVSYYLTHKLSLWASFYSGTNSLTDRVDLDMNVAAIGLDYRMWKIVSFGLGTSSTTLKLSDSVISLTSSGKQTIIFRSGLVMPLKDWFSVNFYIDATGGENISHSAFLSSMSFYF